MTEFVHKSSEGPQRVGTIKYGVLTGSEMRDMAHVICTRSQIYQQPTMEPMPDGVLDSRMGVSDQKSHCQTCLQDLKVCPGHFGIVDLQLPVFHAGYFQAVLTVLQCICKTCSHLFLERAEKEKLLKRIRSLGPGGGVRKVFYKKVVSTCKKATLPRQCNRCGALNGQVRKAGVLKLYHDKYKGGKDTRIRSFLTEFNTAVKYNGEISSHLTKAQDDLTPLRVLNLLRAIPPDECELLDMAGMNCQPEALLMTHHLVPPVSIRPVVAMEASGVTNQDDITMRLYDIIQTNDVIRESGAKGTEVKVIMEGWENLQVASVRIINSELRGLQAQAKPGKMSKPGRGLCQRLKGKKGRIRGNLSGKRVNFTARTVISPDPNLEIDQVAVPVEAAMKLTYPEVVTPHNQQRLREAVMRGATQHPGANYVEKNGRKSWLKLVRDLKQLAESLQFGDIVERHVIDDDLCLFNRQPSLHRMSIMCHRAKIRPWRTFRFNECVCAPYNADFDGDEMNLHVPQTEEARAEASVLMGVTRNLITPCNGNPLVAATQDFLTASFLLSNKDRFYDRAAFTQIITWAIEGAHVTIPPPAILKPIEFWTGKQVLSLLIKETIGSNVVVNFETEGKTYSGSPTKTPRHMCHLDGYVVVRNSELLCGTFDKKSIGSGTKDNLFHVLLRDFSPEVAASRMCRLSKLCGRWLGSHGFSIGVTDVWPSGDLVGAKEQLVDEGYKLCNNYVRQLEDGSMEAQPGFTKDQTLEAKMNGALSKVRELAGKECMSQLHHLNAPLIMAKCGSKGGQLNISQMAACVGQQTIMGSRIPNGFINRTLPHFLVSERSPASKGFVKNSFFSGLTPTEFFFHTMAGREGLVDTAVKTADTGYMQRRLMKALEDMTVNYDYTIRNSEGTVMQLVYGDDGLDPANMESNNTPVSFSHVLAHSLAIAPWRPPHLRGEEREKEEKREKGERERGGGREGEGEGKGDGEDILGDGELALEVLERMNSREYLDNTTTMVSRDLLHFFFGKEIEKETILNFEIEKKEKEKGKEKGKEKEKDKKEEEDKKDKKENILIEKKEEERKGKKEKGSVDQQRQEALIQERERRERERERKEEKKRVEGESVEDVHGVLLPLLKNLSLEGKLNGTYGGIIGKIVRTRGSFMSTLLPHEKNAEWMEPVMANTVSLTRRQLNIFFKMLIIKLRKARVEPGTPVGAVAGQSIGEPATQMTLKTFHFAGVATMNITLGVPRIKEIINATKKISTPIVTAKLVASQDIRVARLVKARVEKTTLGEISKFIKQTYSPDGCFISIKLDINTIEALQMDVKADSVKASILSVPRTKLKSEHVLVCGPYRLQVHPPNSSKETLFYGLQALHTLLPTVIVSGIPSITRAVINEEEKKGGGRKYVLMAEGYGEGNDLRSVMNIPGVKGEKTMSNHIVEMEETLGIEAARASIINQILVTMRHHGIAVDIRHVTLLADVMTFKGTILGITRFGVAKMRDSVLTLASFETPTDHLFDAAIHGRADTICGVSDSVIVGNPMPVGTGLFRVYRQSSFRKRIPKPKETLLGGRKFGILPSS